MTASLNIALMQLSKRAENVDRSVLVSTFVSAGPLFHVLRSADHQVLYGRRGTGKTHAILYLAESVVAEGHAAIYVDMRTIGSTGGLYADTSVPTSERGTRLLMDVLEAIHDALMDVALEAAIEGEVALDVSTLPKLDEFAAAITEVRVDGDVEVEERERMESEGGQSRRIGIEVGNIGAAVVASHGRAAAESEAVESSRRVSGPVRHRVHFGAVHQLLQQIAAGLPHERIWILLDEWSEIPLELQPILADLIKRALFPLRGVTVKIAAIEQRSRFRSQAAGGGYIGIELGADAAADIDLDDFMVFGNDEALARNFFADLLHRHVLSALEQRQGTPSPESADAFVREAFTQRPVFDELVKAAEGVPRDAINIVSYASRFADDSAIGMPNVRQAARRWYLQDKEAAVSANPEAKALLNWIIDEVIQGRRARAFLLRQGESTRSDLIRSLYDARVLHVIKKGVSSRDHAGVRFDVYAIDYGWYVELLTTARAPEGLFEVDGDEASGFVEVPADDYRSIRRAILDLARFEGDRN